MKGWAALLLAVWLAAACASAKPAVPMPTGSPTAAASTTPSAVPTATRPVDVPSGSCIFALDVDNQTASYLTVAVNGTTLGNVASNRLFRFYAGMNGPPLPWAVVVTRTSDGEALASKDYPEGTMEGRITVRDEPHEPLAVAAGYCP